MDDSQYDQFIEDCMLEGKDPDVEIINIRKRLARVILENLVCTHEYEGGNPAGKINLATSTVDCAICGEVLVELGGRWVKPNPEEIV